MPKIILMLVVLFIASVKDIKGRTIPNWMPLIIVLISFIPTSVPSIGGILVALPLLAAAVFVGGVGGGDIKLVGATGMVLGFETNLFGLVIGMTLMVLYHYLIVVPFKGNFITEKADEKIGNEKLNNETDEGSGEKESASYPLVPFLFVGMLISVLVNA